MFLMFLILTTYKMKNESKKNKLNMEGMLKAFPAGTAAKVQALSDKGYKLHTAISMAALKEKPTKRK